MEGKGGRKEGGRGKKEKKIVPTVPKWVKGKERLGVGVLTEALLCRLFFPHIRSKTAYVSPC